MLMSTLTHTSSTEAVKAAFGPARRNAVAIDGGRPAYSAALAGRSAR